MSNNKNVRDLIYFDIDKALSLWSQIQEGLLKELLVSEEESEKDSTGGSAGCRPWRERSRGAREKIP